MLTEAQNVKVEELLSKMTLDEKIGQMNQEFPSIVGGFDVPFPELTASLVRPVKELKNFTRVSLEAGEEQRVALSLRKKDMGFYNNQGEYVLEDGKFNIFIGGNSKDCLSQQVAIHF